jgi:hypothetical protein
MLKREGAEPFLTEHGVTTTPRYSREWSAGM